VVIALIFTIAMSVFGVYNSIANDPLGNGGRY
jgi:hypothetical protein